MPPRRPPSRKLPPPWKLLPPRKLPPPRGAAAEAAADALGARAALAPELPKELGGGAGGMAEDAEEIPTWRWRGTVWLTNKGATGHHISTMANRQDVDFTIIGCAL